MTARKRTAKRRSNAELDAAERRMLDDVATGRARGAKRGTKAFDKLVAKYGRLLDDKLVELDGGSWDGAHVRLVVTSKGSHERQPKRTENPRPSLADLGTCSEHGRVHELQVERGGKVESHRWTSSRPVLLWSPKQRAFVFVSPPGKLPSSRRGDVPRDDGAAATWERFFGKRALHTRELVVPSAPLHELGRGVLLAYQTPHKWRGGAAEHKLGRKVRAWMGTAGGRRVFVVAGGNLRMTARGIEG